MMLILQKHIEALGLGNGLLLLAFINTAPEEFPNPVLIGGNGLGQHFRRQCQ